MAWLRLLGYSSTSTLTMSPGFAPCDFAARDQHLGARLAALEHEIDAALAAKLPDDARLAARENLDDVPFAAAARVAGARGDAIAVPKQLHLARGEIEIVAAVVGPQETEAVAMREHLARHDVEVARQAVLVGAVPQQLAVAHHGAHAGLERAPVLFRADLETWRERLERERLPGLLHRREDLVATRDLVLVAPFVGGPAFFGPRGIRSSLAARAIDWIIVGHLSRGASDALAASAAQRV